MSSLCNVFDQSVFVLVGSSVVNIEWNKRHLGQVFSWMCAYHPTKTLINLLHYVNSVGRSA